MRIVFVQSQNTENGEVAIENIREMACRHALPGDFWLLPEVFDTGWNLRPGERIDGSQNIGFLRQLSQEFSISIGGSFYLAVEGCIHNRFYVVTADGSEYYCDKRHLFGDFELMNVTPGDTLLTFPLNGIMFRAIVCYDLRFPVRLNFAVPVTRMVFMACSFTAIPSGSKIARFDSAKCRRRNCR